MESNIDSINVNNGVKQKAPLPFSPHFLLTRLRSFPPHQMKTKTDILKTIPLQDKNTSLKIYFKHEGNG